MSDTDPGGGDTEKPPHFEIKMAAEIAELLPLLRELGDDHGSLPGGLLGGASYHPLYEELFSLFAATGFIFPFDWNAWQEEAEKYRNGELQVAAADLDTLRRLVTLHVRKDRYVSGWLMSVINDGHLLEIVERIARLYRERRRTTH